MNAYIVLVLFVFISWCATRKGTATCKYKNTRFNKMNIFLVVSFFSIFLLSALRSKYVGSDTESYFLYYNNVANLEWSDFFSGGWDNHSFTTEKGYMVFEKICNELMIPPQMFIALCAGIFIYSIYKLVFQYTKNSYLIAVISFLAIGSYLLSLNALRQGIGVGLCCIAWMDLQRGNKKSFIIKTLLACTFHVSCCIFFLALVFEKIPASKKNLLISIIVMTGFGFIGASILPFILQWFPIYAKRYGKGVWMINEANGIVVVWVLVIMICVLLAFKKDWRIPKNHTSFEICIFSLLYVCINIIGLSFDGVQRLSMLFQPFLILLFDESFGLFHGRIKMIYQVIVLSCMILLFIKASSTPQYIYIPFWT